MKVINLLVIAIISLLICPPHISAESMSSSSSSVIVNGKEVKQSSYTINGKEVTKEEYNRHIIENKKKYNQFKQSKGVCQPQPDCLKKNPDNN